MLVKDAVLFCAVADVLDSKPLVLLFDLYEKMMRIDGILLDDNGFDRMSR